MHRRREGRILLEQKARSEPDEIVEVLQRFGRPLKRIGLEAGPTSLWLFSVLRAAGYPALCLECRYVKASLSAMRNKTDRNDARGIAHLVRLGWFRVVHVKSEEAQQIRMLLVNRTLLLSKLQDIENSVRGSLKVFGLKLGHVTKHGFEARVMRRPASPNRDDCADAARTSRVDGSVCSSRSHGKRLGAP
jgi:transposase